MSESLAMSVETVLQPFREACEQALLPMTTGIVRTEVLSAEVKRVGVQCASDLQVMTEGVRADSAVARQAHATARLHREEERVLDGRLEQLQDEVGAMVERTRNYAVQQQAVVVPAGDRCRSAQRAAASLDVTASAVDALHESTVAATDAVAAAADRLRALLRHQG